MQVLVNPCQGLRPGADVLQGDYPMLFSVGVGRNAPPWYQPSGSGKEIVLSRTCIGRPVYSFQLVAAEGVDFPIACSCAGVAA